MGSRMAPQQEVQQQRLAVQQAGAAPELQHAIMRHFLPLLLL